MPPPGNALPCGLRVRVRQIPGRMGGLSNRADLEAAVKRMEDQEAAQLAAPMSQPRQSSGRIERRPPLRATAWHSKSDVPG